MHLSQDAHMQAVRDRQQALRRDADAHRLVTRTPRTPLAHRLRCAAVRLRLPVVAPEGCDGRRQPVAGSA
jgi:hypothetical protein